jgi:UDP-2,3-diacylglucosamine pyrophosphatase LpxH
MGRSATQLFDYLVVSDLHLQEVDLNPTGRLFYFDQEFTDFLRYYRQRYQGTRRWRLIIAGDFIEFYLKVHEQPNPDDRLLKGATLTETDLKFFPGTERQKSVWKLDRIVRSHQLLFIALARFILDGHEIYILRGNHDLEFFWPEVQTHFRLLLAQFHPAEASYLEMKKVVEERIHFLPWFYLERDLLFVEHGHQYDAYCSSAHNLHPVLPHNHQVLELPLSAFVLRYFHARIEHMEPAAMENINSIPKSFWHLIRHNRDQILQMPFYLLEMVVRILKKFRPVQPALDLPIQAMETKIREDLKATYGLSDEHLQIIERLARSPVLLSRWQTIKCFSLDLLIAGIAALLIGIGLSLTASTPTWRWAPAAISCLVVLVLGFLGRARLATFNDHRNLRDIAHTIRDTLGCRFVVFGHSHDPDVYPLSASKDQWYFNVGTWAPRSKEAQFVYLEIINTQISPSAHLMRWDRKSEQPLELDMASYVKGSAEREAMLAGERAGLR